MESILVSIKKLLGITSEYEHFDADIVMHINTALFDLTLLGIGPPEGFAIKDEEALWSDFVPENPLFEAIKEYIYLRVKLVFDHSSLSASEVESINRTIDRIEWKLCITAEQQT